MTTIIAREKQTFDRKYGFDPKVGYDPMNVLEHLLLARRILKANKKPMDDIAGLEIDTGSMLTDLGKIISHLEWEKDRYENACSDCGDYECDCDDNWE